MLYGQSFMESIVEAQVDGSTLSAAAAASALPAAAKFTLPANFFNRIGKKLIIEAAGRQSVAVTTPGTLTWDVRFGGTVVFNGAAMVMDTAGFSTKPWFLRIVLTCRAIGTSGNLMGVGLYTYSGLAGTPATPPKGSLSALLPWDTTPAVGNNFDTTTTQQVDLFYTPSLGTASMTLHQYSLITEN